MLSWAVSQIFIVLFLSESFLRMESELYVLFVLRDKALPLLKNLYPANS